MLTYPLARYPNPIIHYLVHLLLNQLSLLLVSFPGGVDVVFGVTVTVVILVVVVDDVAVDGKDGVDISVVHRLLLEFFSKPETNGAALDHSLGPKEAMTTLVRLG